MTTKQTATSRENAAAGTTLRAVPVDSISTEGKNDRLKLDDAALAALAADIKQRGVLQPIAVNRVGGNGHLDLIYGERRLRAARIAGLVEIDAHVHSGLSPEQVEELRTVENLQREDLNPIEEAHAINRALKQGRPLAKIAATMGRTVHWVEQRLELLKLHPQVRDVLAAGRITVAHARLISRVGRDQQITLLNHCIGTWNMPGSTAWQEAMAGDHLITLEALRRDVATQLRNLNARDCRWPKDGRFGGKRACVGCPYNTATHPELFEGIKLPSTAAVGTCTNEACFRAKVNAWAKAPERKEQLKREAARAKDAAAERRKRGEPDARDPWPATPRERHHRALGRWYHHVVEAVSKAVPSARDDDPKHVRKLLQLLHLAGHREWLTDKRSLVKVVADPGTIGAACQAAFKRLRGVAPLGRTSYRREYDDYELAWMDGIEALARDWQVAIPPRPDAKDFVHPKTTPGQERAKQAARKARKAKKGKARKENAA